MNESKKMIMDAFWSLLEEIPFNKITVKLIVEKCNVNRNTFYYYFQDIPSLTEEILKNKIYLLIDRHCRVGSLEECISVIVKFFLTNKNAVMHLYRALPRDIFINHTGMLMQQLVEMYIENIIESLNVKVDNKNIVIRLFKCLLLGITIDWLDNDMSYDLLSDSMLVCKEQKGIGLEFLLNASSTKK